MAAQKPAEKLKVYIVRAFIYDEKVLKAGTVIDLPRTFARTMIASNKAALHIEKAEDKKPEIAAPELKKKEAKFNEK